MGFAGGNSTNGDDDRFRAARERMATYQIAGRGVEDPRVLNAMREVPRHLFMSQRDAWEAYEDHPVPIGEGQTISQPYIVAYMIEAMELPDQGRVLEVGTGLGYQAAVMAAAGFTVYTIEILPGLAERAAQLLRRTGYDNVHTRVGDGTEGWPEEAPFDGIIVAAAARRVPEALVDQLAPDGTLLIPVGDREQILWRYRRTASGLEADQLFPVRFVPLR